jgi:hypothetical protein
MLSPLSQKILSYVHFLTSKIKRKLDKEGNLDFSSRLKYTRGKFYARNDLDVAEQYRIRAVHKNVVFRSCAAADGFRLTFNSIP